MVLLRAKLLAAQMVAPKDDPMAHKKVEMMARSMAVQMASQRAERTDDATVA